MDDLIESLTGSDIGRPNQGVREDDPLDDDMLEAMLEGIPPEEMFAALEDDDLEDASVTETDSADRTESHMSDITPSGSDQDGSYDMETDPTSEDIHSDEDADKMDTDSDGMSESGSTQDTSDGEETADMIAQARQTVKDKYGWSDDQASRWVREQTDMAAAAALSAYAVGDAFSAAGLEMESGTRPPTELMVDGGTFRPNVRSGQ